MAIRKSLVLKDGKISELPSGDTLEGSGGADNFSFHKVLTGVTLSIPTEQHMICTSLEIDGFLDLDGGLVFL